MHAPPPSTIGRYRLLQKLGEGGMGEVWEAQLEGPGGFRKRVALKILRESRSEHTLLEEARLGALLQHPNVVAVHAVEPHETDWVVVMEFVRGVALDQLLHGGPLPPRALIEVGVQLCAGLAHIHDLVVEGRPLGLVHRDIKLGNVLIERSGLVKITDLGIATTTGESRACGTPGYMPPEQWLGRVGPRADLFATGVLLVRCLLGEHPLGRGHEAARTAAQVERALAERRVAERVEQLVPGLGDVVLRCLQPAPEDRWPDASSLGAALAALRHRQAPGGELLEHLRRARPDLNIHRTPPSVPHRSEEATALLSRGNLPSRRDPFVGRQAEVRQVRALLGDAQLVTLAGHGGAGKTRLAIEVARELQQVLSGGAWFFDLTEARTAAGIHAAMARTLGIDLQRTDPTTQIGCALAAKGRALLVFDNVEQCVKHLGATVGHWVDQCPDARVLCTSRIVLGLRGERVLRLGPLPDDDAVELFLRRAPAKIPDEDRPLVLELVQALDGLPLALELAAARTALLPVRELLARLGPRLLSGGPRHLPDRHQSLEACITWSWELLEPALRDALAQLSVFDGGFDLAAADAVLELPPEAGWALDALHRLVEASLVRVDPSTGRFSMFVVVRQFAAERLDAEPLSRPWQRHGDWYAQLRDTAVPAELDNLVVACRRALQAGRTEVAAGCALGAWHVLTLQGPLSAAVDLLHAVVIARPDDLVVRRAWLSALAIGGNSARAAEAAVPAIAEARAAGDRAVEGALHSTRAHALSVLSRADEARPHLEQALALHREVGDRRAEAGALFSLGTLALDCGAPLEAETWLRAALTTSRELGDARQEGLVLGCLAAVRIQLGDIDGARSCSEAALARHVEVGNRRMAGVVLGNLANVHLEAGRLDEAAAHYGQALDIHRAVGNLEVEGSVCSNLGNLHRDQGRFEKARELYGRAIQLHRRTGRRRSEAIALTNLGELTRLQGDPDGASELYQRALVIHRELGTPHWGICIALLGLAVLAVRRGDFEAAEPLVDHAGQVGEEIHTQPIRGLVHEVRGALRQRQGRPEDARAELQQAAALLEGQSAEAHARVLARLAGLTDEQEARVLARRARELCRTCATRVQEEVEELLASSRAGDSG